MKPSSPNNLFWTSRFVNPMSTEKDDGTSVRPMDALRTTNSQLQLPINGGRPIVANPQVRRADPGKASRSSNSSSLIGKQPRTPSVHPGDITVDHKDQRPSKRSSVVPSDIHEGTWFAV